MSKDKSKQIAPALPHPPAAPTDPQRPAQGSSAFRFAAMVGPLPPPEVLARYDEVSPGLAERIVKMAEGQANHRRDMEKRVVIHEARRSWGGLVAGVIVSLAFVAISGYLIHAGHDVSGTILGTLDLVALVAVFVYGKATQRDGDGGGEENGHEQPSE